MRLYATCGERARNLNPAAQTITKITKRTGAKKTAPPFSQTQNGMATRDDIRINDRPFLQAQNGTGRPQYRQQTKGNIPFVCKASKRNICFKLSEPRSGPAGRPRYRHREILPFVCTASKRNLFLIYWNRGPARRVDRDTDKGK